MPDDNVLDAHMAKVVRDLREKPLTYTVEINHLVIGGQWMIQSIVRGVDNDQASRASIAADLRDAADQIEKWDMVTIPVSDNSAQAPKTPKFDVFEADPAAYTPASAPISPAQVRVINGGGAEKL